MLTDGQSVLSDANKLHGIQQTLRITATAYGKSPDGPQHLAAGEISKIRNVLNNQIDSATGGKFKPAQKRYADASQIQEAFLDGVDTFKNPVGSRGIENMPEFLDEWMRTASAPEIEARRMGARVAVKQAVGAARNAARRGEAFAQVEFNRAKMETLFGRQEAKSLAQALDDEHLISVTNNKVFEGSMTQPRQEGAKATIVRGLGQAGTITAEVAAPAAAMWFGGPLATLPVLGAVGARRAISKIGKKMDLNRNAEMARDLTATGRRRNALVQSLVSEEAARATRGRTPRAIGGQISKYGPAMQQAGRLANIPGSLSEADMAQSLSDEEERRRLQQSILAR
jgi:hypothetical protein